MIKRFVCLLGAVIGGVSVSQVPEYTQQYTQRLAGAVDELDIIIAQFDTDAARFGLTRQEGLERYRESEDDFLTDRGLSMQAVFKRHEALSTQLAQLRQADPLTRFTSLAQYYDTDVGAAAFSDFEPAVPVSVDGFAHALAGWIAGYALFWAGASAAGAPFRKRRSKVKISRA